MIGLISFTIHHSAMRSAPDSGYIEQSVQELKEWTNDWSNYRRVQISLARYTARGERDGSALVDRGIGRHTTSYKEIALMFEHGICELGIGGGRLRL